jgi:hypothetical protein
MDDQTVQELIQRRIQQIENPPPPNEHLNKVLQKFQHDQKRMNTRKAIRLKSKKNSCLYKNHPVLDFKKD